MDSLSGKKVERKSSFLIINLYAVVILPQYRTNFYKITLPPLRVLAFATPEAEVLSSALAMEAFFLVRSLDMKEGDFATVTLLGAAPAEDALALPLKNLVPEPGLRLVAPPLPGPTAALCLSLPILFVVIDATFSRRCLPGLATRLFIAWLDVSFT